MKLEIRSLAMRVEQKLASHLPAHIAKVTYSPFKGVKITALVGASMREYTGGTSWTTCEMAANKLIKDYTMEKYRKHSELRHGR